tara:strand:+ start:1379 stop:1816 length:438 start_codon:yes stop_codon:yes gene_type:complete
MKNNMVKGYIQYLREDCGCGEDETASTIEPIEIFSKIANTMNTKADLCPNCSQFPEECGCKGSCGNCGQDNGSCDCALNQEISIGDMVRNVNKNCPQGGSMGRVIDMPSNNSVTFSVVKPGGNASLGQLLNKTREQLTIDEKYRV